MSAGLAIHGDHMATKTQSEPKPAGETRSHSTRNNFESDLALEFLRVVEDAAIASAKTMGQGDRKRADQVATEAMRSVMDSVPMDGTIVIGEGERDEAPMLYIGEKVGKNDGGDYPEVDIAVDPLEGTNLCANGFPGPSPCWLPPSAVDCCTPPTATWKRWWSAHPAKAWSISKHLWVTILRSSPRCWDAK